VVPVLAAKESYELNVNQNDSSMKDIFRKFLFRSPSRRVLSHSRLIHRLLKGAMGPAKLVAL
jgi:hypothetical protein